MSKEVSQDVKFKTNLIGFLEFSIEILEDLITREKISVDLFEITVMKEIIEKLDGKDLLKKFIDNSYDYWVQIKKKEVDFFDKNSSKIFGDLAADKLQVLKYIFSSSEVDQEIKDTIWQYLHSFVKISIMHVNKVRQLLVTQTTDETGKPKKSIKWQNNQEFTSIKLDTFIKIAKEFGISIY